MLDRPAIKPAPDTSVPLLLDAAAVARLIGCSARHVDRMSREGGMPAPLRLGTMKRWSRDAILEWVERGCPAIDARKRGGQ